MLDKAVWEQHESFANCIKAYKANYVVIECRKHEAIIFFRFVLPSFLVIKYKSFQGSFR